MTDVDVHILRIVHQCINYCTVSIVVVRFISGSWNLKRSEWIVGMIANKIMVKIFYGIFLTFVTDRTCCPECTTTAFCNKTDVLEFGVQTLQ
jgi:hypothetical protein